MTDKKLIEIQALRNKIENTERTIKNLKIAEEIINETDPKHQSILSFRIEHLPIDVPTEICKEIIAIMYGSISKELLELKSEYEKM